MSLRRAQIAVAVAAALVVLGWAIAMAIVSPVS